MLAGLSHAYNFMNVMSTKNKKAVTTGIRYTDAQKKEIIDFIAKYNSENGRGGQSAASKKFKVTQLTIGGWLKAAGLKPGGKKAAKKAAKPAAKKGGKSASNKKGIRYTPEQKQEVIDFVNAHNAAKGRGGQNQAAKKFKLSVLTVSSWLRKAGAKPAARGKKTAVIVKAAPKAVSSVITAKVQSLLALADQVRKAEAELAGLRAKFDALKESVRAAL
jgi:hypothetical protein